MIATSIKNICPQEVPRTIRTLSLSSQWSRCTRPDICFAVSALSQFMTDPRHVHWIAAKHVLRYLRGTIGYGLRYTSGGSVTLSGYTDSDWAESVVDRKSTSGYCFSMGSAMISWSSRKQSFVALNTAEAEYISTSDAGKEAIWHSVFM